MGFFYRMQARDSVDGNLYYWTTNSRDFSAVGYPGPNTAEEVCVLGRNGDVESANDSFLELTDTPVDMDGAAGLPVVVNETETALEYGVAIPRTFTALTDTLAGYAEKTRHVIRVNEAEAALEAAFAGSGVYPDEFDAAGDGATDDSIALQDAINYAQSNGVPLLLGSKVYRHTLTLTVAAGNPVVIIGEGEQSVLFCDGNNVTGIVFNAGRSGIRDLTIRGNQTGAGGVSPAGGHGVDVNADDFVSIRVRWENIGLASGATSVVCLRGINNNADRMVVHGNTFDTTCRSITGPDVQIGGKECIISECRTRSETDSLAYCSGATTDTSGLVITGNIATREGGVARHGVLAMYGGDSAQPVRGVITNNYFQGFAWDGVYLTANSVAQPATGGGVVVSGNVIVECGGLVESLSGGIVVSGNAGAALSSNLILRTGYDSTGTTRGYNVPGIVVGLAPTKRVAITGNTIADGNGSAIGCNTQTSYTVDGLTIVGNTLRANAVAGIFTQTQSSGISLSNVLIADNDIEVGSGTVGITCQNINAVGVQTRKNITIRGNRITGPGTGNAINYVDPVYNPAIIQDNQIDSFARGVVLTNWASDGDRTPLFRVTGNTFRSCVYPLSGGSAHVVACDSHSDTAAKEGTHAYYGALIGSGSTGAPIFVVNGTAAPTVGNWLVGDTVRNTAPAVGSPQGWVCTVAGAPGTWAALPNL